MGLPPKWKNPSPGVATPSPIVLGGWSTPTPPTVPPSPSRLGLPGTQETSDMGDGKRTFSPEAPTIQRSFPPPTPLPLGGTEGGSRHPWSPSAPGTQEETPGPGTGLGPSLDPPQGSTLPGDRPPPRPTPGPPSDTDGGATKRARRHDVCIGALTFDQSTNRRPDVVCLKHRHTKTLWKDISLCIKFYTNESQHCRRSRRGALRL